MGCGRRENRLYLKKSSGAILVVTLWILIILTVFAVALGQRASLEIKLAEYNRDKLRALELAKAAIQRAIWEKLNWEKENVLYKDVDALSESWANNEEAFNNISLGEGVFTVSYPFGKTEDGEEILLYGMQDEQSKININKADVKVLENLLKDYDNGDEIAFSIIAWRKNKDISNEDVYYETDELPYPRKRGPFQSLPELLLVRNMTPEILYGKTDQDSEGQEGIAQYLTVHGERAVNINTASEKVLQVLIAGTFPNFLDIDTVIKDFVEYRNGPDGQISTEDDGWFSDNLSNIDATSREGEVINLDKETDSTDRFYQLLQLKNKGLLSVTSNIYTVQAEAELKKVKQSITATIKFNGQGITYLYWHQN